MARAVATAPHVSGFKFHPWRFKAHAIATGFLTSNFRPPASPTRVGKQGWMKKSPRLREVKASAAHARSDRTAPLISGLARDGRSHAMAHPNAAAAN